MKKDEEKNNYYTDGENNYNTGGYTREGGYTYGYNNGGNNAYTYGSGYNHGASYTYGSGNYNHGGGGSYTYGAGNYTHGGGGSYTYGAGGNNSYTTGNYVNGANYTQYGNYNGQYYNKPSAVPTEINYKEWLIRFLNNWYLFVIGVVVCLCVGFVINRKWVPEYTSESKLLVDDGSTNGSLDMLQSLMGGNSKGYANVNNQLIILGSYPILNRTIQKLPFSIDYYTKGRFKTLSLYGREPIHITEHAVSPDAYSFSYRFTPVDSRTFTIEIEDVYDSKLSKFADTFKPVTGHYGERVECSLFSIEVEKMYLLPNQTDFFFQFRDMRSLEEEFANRLELAYMGTTKDPSTVVSVALTSDVPQRDADFLNQLGKEFLAANLEEKNEEVTRTIDFINEQLFLLSDSLNSSESRLRQYRAMNNLVDISSYSTQVVTKLDELDTKRSEYALKDAYFAALSKYLTQTVMDEKIVAPSSIGVADPTLLELVAQFNELQQKRSDLGEKNPQYSRYSKRMNEIRETMLEVLKNVRHIHNLERQAFEREYADVTADIKNLPEKEFEMVNYERTYKINDNYYTFLLQKESEAQIARASNVPDNKILQEARTTLLPVNTRDKMMVYLISLIIGLLIPAAYLILLALFDNKINTEEDVLKISQFPIISSLLHTERKDLVASTKSKRSVFTERYRLLRTRIELFTQRKTGITILTTSSESGDGKSTVNLNLAGIYSMVSQKVVLLDMDLRNPSLTRKTEYKDRKGMVHVLINDAELDEVIIKDDERLGFDFVPAGIVPPNAAELIGSDKMREVLEQLRARYDYIIIDTSPLGFVSDAMELMKMSDINLIVCRAMKTNKKFFKNFLQQLGLDMVTNVGIVLNDIPTAKHSGFLGFAKYNNGKYYTGGRYGYGYGYYYGSNYYNRDGDKYYHSEDKTDDDTKA